MVMVMEIEGERFTVSSRLGPDECWSYDFTWLSGPGESTYGFTIGSTSPGSEATRTALEEHARTFLESFFAPDGIGPCDFPEFVAARGER